MKQIRIPFLIVVFSMMLVSSAFSLDISQITTISSVVGGVPTISAGLAVLGDGGGLSGIGDALIGQYYDVRPLVNPGTPEGAVPAPPGIATTQFTLFCIVNTDPVNAVVARLRFREWMRSREVLDLDIPLTSNDVWCGVVSRLPTGGAALWSPDRYVTNIVAICPDATAFTTGTFPASPGIPFRTFLIEAAEANPLARTEYGYFEIFGEENVGIGLNNTFTRLDRALRNVDNVLMGTTYLVRPEVATSHQYNMTAIANFSIDPCGIYRLPGTEAPNFLSEVQGGGQCDGLAGNTGTGGFDNLEGLLSKRWLDFQFVVGLDPADVSQTPTYTTVGVTFPTKHFHYGRGAGFPLLGNTLVTSCPFGTPFTSASEITPGEVVRFSFWNRAEVPLIPPTDPISPSPGGECTTLPYEVNLIGLYPNDPGPTAPIFRNNVVVKTANVGSGQTFYNGWGEIDLSPALTSTVCDTRGRVQGENIPAQPTVIWGWFNFFNNFFNAYRGLPTLAFVMTEFFNDSVNGYYGNTVPAQFGVDWRRIPPDAFP